MIIITNFGSNLGITFKYMGWTVINPKNSFQSLVNEPKQVTYAIYSFFITSVLFAIILIPAVFFLRPTGWLPMFIKGIPSNMIYVYFCLTAPLSFMLNMLVFSGIEMTGMFIPKPDALTFKSTFSTSMIGISLVVLLDFITESIPIIYFFITKDKSLLSIIDFFSHNTANAHFNIPLLLTMFFLYGIMFLCMIMLLTCSLTAVKKVKQWQALIGSLISTLLYWILMIIWIF